MDDVYTVKTLSPKRKVIAARMTESKQTIPHFRLVSDIQLDALLALRADLRQGGSDLTPSLNDFFIVASAGALIEVPAVNIQWAENTIHEYRTADISVVMAIDGEGLATPIIRRAETKTVFEISSEVKELARRAARNALKMSEVAGGSFSVSNLGMYGVDQFDAIINAPQCAILALGSGRPRVVVSNDRTTGTATVMRATLSVDHRAIDGATAAEFLTAFRRRVEQPEGLLPVKE